MAIFDYTVTVLFWENLPLCSAYIQVHQSVGSMYRATKKKEKKLIVMCKEHDDELVHASGGATPSANRGARSSSPRDKREWGGVEKIFSSLRALVWSKNKGEAPPGFGTACSRLQTCHQKNHR